MGWRTILLLMLVFLLLPGLGAVPADLPDSVARGDEALAAGHLTEAIEFYLRAAAYPEGEPAVTLKIAQTQMAIARQADGDPSSAYQAARDAWLDALAVDDAASIAALGLAETHLALGERAAAHEWAIAAVDTPASSSFWHQLARAHLENEEWALAVQAYGAIASTEPENSEAQFWAGALQLGTDYPLVQHHLLLARNDLLFRERVDKLLLALDDVTGITDLAYRAARLGLAYLHVGEPALARHWFEVALSEEPTYADAWAYLGLARDQLGEDGRRAIAHAIELEPGNPLAHSLLGHHWLRYNQFGLARQEFIVVWELEPENPSSMVDIASTYRMEGDYTSAEAWYQAAIRRAPEDATLWVQLARFHLDTLNDVADGGLLVAQKAVALAPENPSALDTLGWAQFLNGQTRLAETNLLAARERDPSNSIIHYHLGRLFESLGDRGEAEAAYREAITLDTTCMLCSAPRPGPYAELAERALNEMGGR